MASRTLCGSFFCACCCTKTSQFSPLYRNKSASSGPLKVPTGTPGPSHGSRLGLVLTAGWKRDWDSVRTCEDAARASGSQVLELMALKASRSSDRPSWNSTHIRGEEEAMEPGRTPGCRSRQMALGVAAFSITASALFKAALSGRSHTIPVRPSECGPVALEMETSRDQDGKCSKEEKTSKHLFLRQPQNESQIPDRRNATFTSHKQRRLVYLPFSLFTPPEHGWSSGGGGGAGGLELLQQQGCRWRRERQALFPPRRERPGSDVPSARAHIAAPEYFWPQLLAVIVIGRSRSPGNTGNSNAFQTKAPEGQRISGGYRWERAG